MNTFFQTTLEPGADLMRFAFVLGIVISLYLYERFHLGTGSVVVPGYLGILVFQPHLIVATLLVAWWCYRIVHQWLPGFVILQAREKYAAVIIVSLGTQLLLLKVAGFAFLTAPALSGLAAPAYLIPGLIAHEMSRQGPFVAAKNTVRGTLLVAAGVLLMAGIAPETAFTATTGVAKSTMVFSGALFPLMFCCSVVLALVIHRNRGWRTGGYVTAAYLVMELHQPVGVLAILGLAILTFLVVRYGLMKRTVLFGRRKFAAMLLVGSFFSWTSLIVVDLFFGGRFELVGGSQFSVMSIVLTGLLANDLERVGAARLAWGLTLNLCFVFSVAFFITEAFRSARIDLLVVSFVFTAGTLAVAAWPGRTDGQPVNNRQRITQIMAPARSLSS